MYLFYFFLKIICGFLDMDKLNIYFKNISKQTFFLWHLYTQKLDISVFTNSILIILINSAWIAIKFVILFTYVYNKS